MSGDSSSDRSGCGGGDSGGSGAGVYVASSKRLFLEPLSLERHLEDFHELWTDADAVKWS